MWDPEEVRLRTRRSNVLPRSCVERDGHRSRSLSHWLVGPHGSRVPQGSWALKDPNSCLEGVSLFPFEKRKEERGKKEKKLTNDSTLNKGDGCEVFVGDGVTVVKTPWSRPSDLNPTCRLGLRPRHCAVSSRERRQVSPPVSRSGTLPSSATRTELTGLRSGCPSSSWTVAEEPESPQWKDSIAQ